MSNLMILNRCPKVSPETGIRTIIPEETVLKGIPLLKITEMEDLEDITEKDGVNIPVYSVFRRMTAKGTFGCYNGKGATHEQAKASAIMESLERYCSEQRESDQVVYGTVEQAMDNGLCVHPANLILPIPVLNPLDSAEIAWVSSFEMFRGEEIWVPACEVFYPYYPQDDLQLYKFHTNGIASGNTIEEAILHGLLELIERDAWSLAEDRNRASSEVVSDDPNSVSYKLIKKFEDQGIVIRLKNLTSDLGITTIGASADEITTKNPEMLTIGVGTHLDPEIAAIRAITEVAQSRATHIHGTKINAQLQKATLEMGYDKIKAINHMWFSSSEKNTNLSEMENLSTPFVLDDIEVVLEKLVERGFDMVICSDLTRPEIGIPVVRMTVPGLEVTTMDPERVGSRIMGRWPPIR